MTKAGDRIRLVRMGEDPYPVPDGSTGTVTEVLNVKSRYYQQICVDWDNGRRLMLLPDVDEWEVINV